ncbi:hypothetical protein [Acetobacterium wieringae]|nr:hypothetical protein [Acetobacterium wieringae]
MTLYRATPRHSSESINGHFSWSKTLHMPFDISFLVFIFKNTLSYDLYLFEKDEIIEKENILMLSENSAKEIGGYDLAIRYNIKFE